MSVIDMIRACALGQRKQSVMFVVGVAMVPDTGHASDADFSHGFRCSVALDMDDRLEMRAKLHDAINAIADIMADRP